MLNSFHITGLAFLFEICTLGALPFFNNVFWARIVSTKVYILSNINFNVNNLIDYLIVG
jgi:hypothetical protein